MVGGDINVVYMDQKCEIYPLTVRLNRLNLY